MSSDDAHERSPERLRGDVRRGLLLDVARDLIVEGGPSSVSMGAIAERAGVARGLVYKYFSNRDGIMFALYERESATINALLRDRVRAADPGLEAKLRALIHGVLETIRMQGRYLTPLRSYVEGVNDNDYRRSVSSEQLSYFTRLASKEYGVSERTAEQTLRILLLGSTTLLQQARSLRSKDDHDFLEDLVMEMVVGSFARLAEKKM
jgi:AcrR family transcriptional regulator